MALQGKWVLNESGTANRADSSGNSNNLVASASIAQATGYGGGANLANNFTGTQYLSIADGSQTGLDFTGVFSIVGRIKRSATGANHTLCGKWSADYGYSYVLIVNSSNKLVGYVSSNGTTIAATVTGSTTISSGTGYRVMFIYDGSTLKLYVDNVEDGSTAYTGAIWNSNADFRIGANGDGTNKANAVLDDFAAFDHALSTEERSAYNGYGDDFSGGAAALAGAATCAVTATGDLSVGGAAAELAGAATCSVTVTADLTVSGSATLSGTLHDREGNVINCSTYNVRINVYPTGNTATAPIETRLITATNGEWLISTSNLAVGTKYVVTFEFIGTYTPLGDVDIAGADVMTAF